MVEVAEPAGIVAVAEPAGIVAEAALEGLLLLLSIKVSS